MDRSVADQSQEIGAREESDGRVGFAISLPISEHHGVAPRASGARPEIAPQFGVGRTTLDGFIIDCDDVYANFLQCSRIDLIGRNVSDFAEEGSFSPDHTRNLAISTKQPVLVNRSYIRDDGSKINCVTQICIIWNPDGTPHSTIGVIQLAPVGPP